MNKWIVLVLLLVFALGPAQAHEPSGARMAVEPARELYVPFEDLHVVLEGGPKRVMLTREEYDALLAKARRATPEASPVQAVVRSAAYEAHVAEGRATITGAFTIETLAPGLHALPLDLGGVALRSAKLGERDAALGMSADGELMLFVEGKGAFPLTLELVASVQTHAATQTLGIRLPTPAAAQFNLTVQGDVEIESGVAVVSRQYIADDHVTRFEVLPSDKGRGLQIVMTLNSHLKRTQRLVASRSVMVAEVTQMYEKLHATMSMAVLHQAVDSFRFAVPAGFEVTDVATPQLAHWTVEGEGEARTLEVKLRKPMSEMVVINIAATRAAGANENTLDRLADWRMPRLQPLDVVSHVAVVAMLLEDRLKAQSLSSDGLIPIDSAVVSRAIPASVFAADPAAPTVRPLVAYYAPQATFDLRAAIARAEARLRVASNVLLTLDDAGQHARGAFTFVPYEEERFSFDVLHPAAWRITSITSAEGVALPFESIRRAEDDAHVKRIRVRIASGMTPRMATTVQFQAEHVPTGWFEPWQSTEVDLPAFVIADAAELSGAIAIDGRDDLRVRPLALEHLVPLDEQEKPAYGLADAPTVLAYRYGQPYRGSVMVERTQPRFRVRTFSFFRIEPELHAVRYELSFEVSEARTRTLSFLLPDTTPANLAISGLDGLAIKEYTSEPAENNTRRWIVVLNEAQRGTLKLAVDFQQPAVLDGKTADIALPIVRADGIDHQSGLIAVEGSAELDIEITAHPRRVDVGELVDAAYQPGNRLLGVFGFVGEPAPVTVAASRHAHVPLPHAIVQRADLKTVLSAEGVSQTSARYLLRTGAMFMEIQLPPQSTLWSITLDGMPTKPQRDGDVVLLDLPAQNASDIRRLVVVYETPFDAMGLHGDLDLSAPVLMFHADEASGGERVPVADLHWNVYPPSGYALIRSSGTVMTDDIAPPPLAAVEIARAGWQLTGGMPGPICLLPALSSARRSSRTAESMSRIRGIHQNMMFYAQAHNGRYPPDLGTLVAEDYIPPDYVISPMDDTVVPDEFPRWSRARKQQWVNNNASYVLVLPNATPSSDADRIAIYEKPGNHKASIGIGYDDNHVMLQLTHDAIAAIQRQTGRGVERIALRSSGGGFFADMMPRHETPVASTPYDGVAAEDSFAPAAEALPKPVDPIVSEEARPTPPPPLVQPPATPQRIDDLLGVRSLNIELAAGSEYHAFHSLGVEPRLRITLVDRDRLSFIAMASGLIVVVVGLRRVRQTIGRKVKYIAGVALLSTAIAMIVPRHDLAAACNGTFCGAMVLIPLYLALGLCFALVRRQRSALIARLPAGSDVAAALPKAVLLFAAFLAVAESRADEVDVAPVRVPDDAIILPYDAESQTGIQDAAQLLVPYEYFVQLWNRAHPDERLEAAAPPADYALAGGSYTAKLTADPVTLQPYLLFNGDLAVDVFTDDPVTIALPLSGGVLAEAALDGRPARISIARPQPNAPNAPPQQVQPRQQIQQPPINEPMLLLHVEGKGRHALKLAVRMHLQSQGGWRIAQGKLPAAPATALTLTVAQAQSDVRISGVADRAQYETANENETIETALTPGAPLAIRWRPRVTEAQIDQSLKAESSAVVDVQEDRVRIAWQVALDFPRRSHEGFTVNVPPGYLVEKIAGPNVRGWELRDNADPAAPQAIDVRLLRSARDRETFTIELRRDAAVDDVFDAPVVTIDGAAMHSGLIVIRRSPMLALRTIAADNLTRTDLPPTPVDTSQSPLGIRPYEAYRFVSTPFTLRLAADAVEAKQSARIQSIVRIGQSRRQLETQVILDVKDRPIYRARIALPADLEVENVAAPGVYEWAINTENDRPTLTIIFSAGQIGRVPIIVLGELRNPRENGDAIALPELAVLDVERQEGQIVIQAAPAFDIIARDLRNCESVLLSATYDWLRAEQREHTRLAIAWRTPDYAGMLALVPRQPEVTCQTTTNIRLTPRAIEETVLIDFNVRKAGVREVAFLLPEHLADARISVPLLRQKIVEPAPDRPQWVRVRIILQDQVMEHLRVLVEHDRVLTDKQHRAAVPIVETGRTDRQFVALENAGRDEVIVNPAGLEPIDRRQSQWRMLASILGDATTHAYIAQRVSGEGPQPALAYQIKPRQTVETAAARIGLAQTVLVLDAQGAYRAAQSYRLDNSTEQYLEIIVPDGASLWTVRVAGQPVKPAQVAGQPDRVRIPLVKTAPGDLDYEVVIKYAGTLDAVGAMRHLNFPFIRTANINVELSQVRLFLPDSHKWFNFDGTMRQVTEQGDLEAGYLAYQTRQLQQVVQTVASEATTFSKLRASKSFKELKGEIAESESAYDYGGNEEFTRRLREQQALLADAEVQFEQLERQTFDARQAGNRDNLNKYFGSQYNGRAVDLKADNNFGNIETGRRSAESNFDDAWLAANALQGQPAEPGDIAGERSESDAGKRVRGPEREKGVGMLGDMPALGIEGGERQRFNLEPQRDTSRSESGDDTVKRYQQQLAGEREAAARADKDRLSDLSENFGPGLAQAPDTGIDGTRRIDPATAAVLASLDVDLALVGSEYRFTTPRGDVQITARAASNHTLIILGRILALVIIVAVVAVIVRFMRKRGPIDFTSRQSLITLAVVGVASLVLGILPGLGALLVLIAIALRIYAWLNAPRRAGVEA